MNHSCLTEIQSVRSIELTDPQPDMPAPARVHAVEDNGNVICGYEPKAADKREPTRHFLQTHMAERCRRCAESLGVEGWL
jgi:hypothetical protein